MRYSSYILTTFLMALLGAVEVVLAQNLIQNPSFESFIDCPKALGNLDNDVLAWQTPTNGSTDYFNACSKAMGTPKNFNGEQPADFGVGYVGFYFYAPEDYREYIQGRLLKTLVRGARYKVSFYVSLAERSDFAIKEFGIQFTEHPVKAATRKVLSRMHLSKNQGDISNYFQIKYSNFYSDKKDWVLVTKEFTANGTENFMIIGNFKNNKRTQKFRTKRNVTQGSYYYLDMVTVNLIHTTHSITNQPEVTNTDAIFQLDKINVFKNLLFDFDAFELVPSALEELEQISLYLAKKKFLNISIMGHTDAIGNETYNTSLSAKRAKAVADYLIKNGISKDRITHKGLGSKNPVETNATSLGRKTNRRVAFVITN